MSLEVEKLKKEFLAYKEETNKNINSLKKNIANFKDKFTGMVNPLELALNKHLDFHEFWHKFFKYLITIAAMVGGVISWSLGFFKDIFK